MQRIWIPRVVAAVKWYDKVIKDFPKTPAAEAAYVAKTQTLLGWRGIVDQTEETKLQRDQYMDRAVKTFSELAKAFRSHPRSRVYGSRSRRSSGARTATSNRKTGCSASCVRQGKAMTSTATSPVVG